METEAEPDLTAAEEAATEVPPEILAESLSQYLHGWWRRVRSGDSGIIPVVLAMAVVAVAFQVMTPQHSFLRPSNLVYIFGLSTIYMVLAMAEIVVLILGEIDLSIGAVALLGGVIAFKLVQRPHPGWPWWAAIVMALVCCGVLGALQGTLAARLRIPSFIVTLGGFLLFRGILVVALGGANGSVGVNAGVPNQTVIYGLVQGLITPVSSWVVLAIVVATVGATLWSRASTRRRNGLVAPPRSLTAIRIALVAVVGAVVVLVSVANRGTSLVAVQGLPWIIPIVLVVLGAWTVVLQRTRVGRYFYAIGGNQSAARLSGIRVDLFKTLVFVISGLGVAVGALILTARLNSGQPNSGQGYELDAIASVVIGGTSLSGGRGTVLGTLAGALLFGVLSNGLVLMNVSPYYQPIIKGAIIVGAVLLDQIGRRRRS